MENISLICLVYVYSQNSWKKEDDKEGEKTDKGLRVSGDQGTNLLNNIISLLVFAYEEISLTIFLP